jgi:hypothetical protein
VSKGQITLRGYMTEMETASTGHLVPDEGVEMGKEGMNRNNEESYVTSDAIENIEETRKGELLICLDILRDKNGLHGNFVGRLVLEGGLECAMYKRVGISTMKAKFFDGSRMAEVTII